MTHQWYNIIISNVLNNIGVSLFYPAGYPNVDKLPVNKSTPVAT